ncbi:MAG: site-specific integrase, partial [Planctomycetes bacterium]|nr:site-specific integrase [Planctomycetota bacterium]
MAEQTIIDEFLNYLRFERHFSPHTAKCYAADLAQFCAHLGGDTARASGRQHFGAFVPTDDTPTGTTVDGMMTETAVLVEISVQQKLRDVTPEDIKDFLAFLGTQNYSKSTIARKLATLRSFYKFCLRRGHVQSHPLASIRTPKQEKRLPKFLEMDQITKLLAAPDTNTLLGARDHAMLEVLFSTGVRVSELVDLSFSDVNFEGGTIRVRGKGKKQRTTPVGPTAIAAIV